MLELINQMPLSYAILGAATLGLAPFFPEPHIWGKLKMLRAGTLKRPLDIFDLAFHSVPFALLAVKLLLMATGT
ncbi:MAG: RND transporter [Rhodobacterales bacterium]|nr:RND transporter [Rhodobacterales bacterium]